MPPSLTPRETRILCAYFGRRAPRGAQLPSLEQAIHSWAKNWPDLGVSPLEAAVGSVVLAGVRDQLPGWSEFCEPYEERDRPVPQPPTRARKVFTPQHLLTIIWGDSWPEAYWLATAPGFGHVVLAAEATRETWGFLEFAIGKLPLDSDPLAGAKAVITERWEDLCARCDQERWTMVDKAGVIDEASAERWADQVWSEEEEEGV